MYRCTARSTTGGHRGTSCEEVASDGAVQSRIIDHDDVDEVVADDRDDDHVSRAPTTRATTNDSRVVRVDAGHVRARDHEER